MPRLPWTFLSSTQTKSPGLRLDLEDDLENTSCTGRTGNKNKYYGLYSQLYISFSPFSNILIKCTTHKEFDFLFLPGNKHNVSNWSVFGMFGCKYSCRILKDICPIFDCFFEQHCSSPSCHIEWISMNPNFQLSTFCLSFNKIENRALSGPIKQVQS